MPQFARIAELRRSEIVIMVRKGLRCPSTLPSAGRSSEPCQTNPWCCDQSEEGLTLLPAIRRKTVLAGRVRAVIEAVFVLALISGATAQPLPRNVDDTFVCQDANSTPRVPPHVSPEIAEKLRQKELKRIRDARLQCDELKRAETFRFEAAKREYEAQRRIEEAKRKEEMERLRKMEEERRAAQAAEAKEMRKPINRLRRAYLQYIYIRSCYRVRQGYLVVWINDIEMEQARGAVTRIENEALNDEPTIDTATVWKELADRKPATVYEAQCKPAYNSLIEAAPSLPDIKDFGR